MEPDPLGRDPFQQAIGEGQRLADGELLPSSYRVPTELLPSSYLVPTQSLPLCC